MMEFTVHGPFVVPLDIHKNGKQIHKDNLKSFWDITAKDIGKRKGVYVFAMKGPRGYTPIYVGMTRKQDFEREAFATGKLQKLNSALLDYKISKLVALFVVHPKQKGKANGRLIDQVETYLITVAALKNSNIKNDRKTKPMEWRIKGCVRSKKGESGRSSQTLRKVMEFGANKLK